MKILSIIFRGVPLVANCAQAQVVPGRLTADADAWREDLLPYVLQRSETRGRVVHGLKDRSIGSARRSVYANVEKRESGRSHHDDIQHRVDIQARFLDRDDATGEVPTQYGRVAPSVNC